jgi:hypothetical protein
MPKIVEYFTKEKNLTPLGVGEAAWTNAGRRIAPAYNEAGALIRESQKGIVQGGEDIVQAAAGNVKGAENEVRAASERVAAVRQQGDALNMAAEVQVKLEKAWASQFKDLYDIGVEKPKGGGGGGFHVANGGKADDPFGILKDHPLNAGGYGAASEILGNGVALTNKISGNKGGFLTGPGDLNQSNRYTKQAQQPFLPGSTPGANGAGKPEGGQTYWQPIGPTPDEKQLKKNFAGEDQTQPFYAGSGQPDATLPNGQEYYQPIGPNTGENGWNFYGGPDQGQGQNGPMAQPSQADSSVLGFINGVGSAIAQFFGGAADAASNYAASYATPDTQAAGGAINQAVSGGDNG